MHRLLAICLVFCVFVIVQTEVYACSCMEIKKPSTAFQETPLIFVGTVKSVAYADSRELGDEFNFNDQKYTFFVDKALKGVKEDEIDIYTSSQGTACGISFREDGQYLVYAYGGTEERKYYSTSICSRTGSAEERADEIAVLHSLAKGKLESRIYGVVYELVRGIYPLREDYWQSRMVMPGVEVIARRGQKEFKTKSDAKGEFRLIGLPKGKYKLELIPPAKYKLGGDYWDESDEEERDQYKNIEIEISEKDNPEGLTIETRIDGRISGRVFDINGKPAGKDICVTLVSEKTAGKEVGDIDYVPACTDSKGRYEFFGIPQGRYFLGFNIESKPRKEFPYPRSYYPAASDLSKATPIVLGRGEKLGGFDLYLPQRVKEIITRGKVVNSDGNPVKGAIIEQYGLYYGEWKEGEPYSMKYIKQPTFEARVKTDENGEFILKLLKGNKYRLNPFLKEKGSYKTILEGKELDIEVTENIGPIVIVLDKKPE